jgi:uncharacterized protein (TIGR02231 family)
MSMRSWMVLALLPLTAGPALADSIEAEAPIAAVTVYPDRAEILRVAELELPAGTHLVRIVGLPGGLIAESLRVEAAADSTLRIGAVEARPQLLSEAATPAERALAAAIRDLERRLRELDDRIRTNRIKLDLITGIGSRVAAHVEGELAARLPDPDSWERTWNKLGAGAEWVLGEIREAELARPNFEAELELRQRELAQVRTGQRASLEAAIGVEAQAATRARLELRYQVPGAGWRPLYEARLDSEAGRVTLVQRGEVTQGTGEAWADVELTLSTARPGAEARMPEIEPWWVDIQEVRPLPAPSTVARDAAKAEASEEAGAAPATPIMAELVASEIAASYRVPALASVAADRAPKLFTLSERELPVRLEARTTPKLAPTAFLYATGAFPGPEPALPGPLLLFRDGAFGGRGELPLTRPGETLALPFGADERIAVAYRQETGLRSSEGIFNRERRLERRYRIEVTNRHGVMLPITVIDQLPVPQDERIRVELLGDTSPPTNRDPDGRLGVLEWTYDYNPGEQRLIRLGFAVRHPEDQQITGF